MLLHDLPDPHPGEAVAPGGEHRPRGRSPGPDRERAPVPVEPRADRGHRPGAERHDALLVPLAPAGAEALAEVDVGDPQARHFGGPAAGGVKELEERLVALTGRRPAVRGGQQPVDLLGRERAGNRVVAARGREQLGGALRDVPLELEEGVEDPQRRRRPGDARAGQALVGQPRQIVAEIADGERGGVAATEPSREVAEVAAVGLERVGGQDALVGGVTEEPLHEEGVGGRAGLLRRGDVEDHAAAAARGGRRWLCGCRHGRLRRGADRIPRGRALAGGRDGGRADLTGTGHGSPPNPSSVGPRKPVHPAASRGASPALTGRRRRHHRQRPPRPALPRGAQPGS